MDIKSGCLKPTLFGCLGIMVIVLLVGGGTALVAWRGLGDEKVEEQELTPMIGSTTGVLDGNIPGRLILELGQGEFQILPARAGEGISVDARYDKAVHELVDHFESTPDSGWVYHVRFRRTMPALQALFRAIMGGNTEAEVQVYLPPDLPIALELRIEEGGAEADLSGLWLTDADIRFNKGGFSLEIDEPLREPLEKMSIIGKMGGFEAEGLGYASPRTLLVDCRMGGAEIDLRGPWVRDCDVVIRVKMGGMAIMVPHDVALQGIPVRDEDLNWSKPEVPETTLRFSVTEKMGEIEFIR